MKEIGDKSAKKAAVLCEDTGCLGEEYLNFRSPAWRQKQKALLHENKGGNHKTTVVYFDKKHPLSDNDSSRLYELLGILL